MAGVIRRNIEALSAALQQQEPDSPPAPLISPAYALLASGGAPLLLSTSERVTDFELQSIVPAQWDSLVEDHNAAVGRAGFLPAVPPIADDDFGRIWSPEICAGLGARD